MKHVEEFFDALAKVAYDYEYEADKLEEDRKKWEKKKTKAGRILGVGTAAGAGIGALLGRFSNRKKLNMSNGRHTGKGALIGAATGAGLGGLVAWARHSSIKDAKRVGKLSPEEKKKYLKYQARRLERYGFDGYDA